MTLLTMIVKMGEGLSKTCAIFSLTLLFSLPLGMIVALLRMSKSKIISGITRFFISILRGTPLMLQLLAVTYGPYYLFELPVSRNKLIPVVIAFAINYAAYLRRSIAVVSSLCQLGSMKLRRCWDTQRSRRLFTSFCRRFSSVSCPVSPTRW